MNPTEATDNDEIFHESHSFQSSTSNTSRRKSLTLLTVTPNIPIPPSLRQSPYLTSPIFSQALPSPTPPSEEDEKWLQDTIPIASQERQPVVLATEGGCQFVEGSLQRRGSIIQLSRRAAQKNGIISLSGRVAKQGGETKLDLKDGGDGGVGLGVGVSGQTGVASPSLLSAVPHNSHGLWPSTHSRRRRSASPRRPEPFNMNETFPFRS
jgi:hypothetical protein